MFDLNAYKNACAQVTLGAEKLEEIITMTEQKKARLNRPLRVALIAAAVAAALCITAVAAVPQAREAMIHFFNTAIQITVTKEGGTQLGVYVPNISLEEAEGRTLLKVDDETIDITDALAQDEGYVYHRDFDDSSLDIRFSPDGSYHATVYDGQGAPVVYYSAPIHATDEPAYEIAVKEGGENAISSITFTWPGAEAPEVVPVGAVQEVYGLSSDDEISE